MAKFKWDKKALGVVEDIFRHRMDVATTHAIVFAKSTANIETSSMIESIRQLEPLLGKRIDYYRYVAGGVNYEYPLRPVFYSYFQEEIFRPFMLPSVDAFIDNLRYSDKRAFSGTGEHLVY